MNDLTVGICELKKNWGEYLQRVKEGDTIIITNHGKPMAQMRPAKFTEIPQRQEIIKTKNS